MGNYEDDNAVTTLHLKHQPEETELGFSSSGLNPQTKGALADEFQNVGLNSYDSDNGGFNYDGKANGVLEDGGSMLSLRPYAGDCRQYIRTGTCKFGLACNFNHPVKRTSLVVKDKDWDSDKAALIECKGAKECPYYMLNGSCGYGAQCVFHHPGPSSIGGLQKSSVNDKSTRQSAYSLGRPTIESATLHLSAAIQPDHAPWSLHTQSNSTSSYQNDYSFQMTANSVPQLTHRHSELTGYQAEEVPKQRSRHAHLNAGANRTNMLERDIPEQVEEFPERPSQPECDYFMKTGDCKFKSACCFHHPKGQSKCILSEKGLPLRPGNNICRHYERLGICKFGRACLFDHPINHNFSSSDDWSTSGPSSLDAGSWME
ncbi:hypothetical protein ACH5RR_014503 [Cinchona calisaya]|uniref:C3H1-type domain-containing protein n=1 Tax=Cinchona calisaya TaxID=153742 RepID=A0ABD3A318_9GENT